MANTDVTVTLAGRFQDGKLTRRQQIMVRITAKLMADLSLTVAPTTAQWNTKLTSMQSVFPRGPMGLQRDAIEAAIWWQYLLGVVGTAGIVSATPNTNDVIAASAYLQGLDDDTLMHLDLWETGDVLAILS